MQLKFLYALGFFLCLSTFASPNECARHCAGNGTKVSAAVRQPTPPQEEEAERAPAALIQLLYI
jgi:hypothetical protein